MDWTALYREHLEAVTQATLWALVRAGDYGGVLLHSGSECTFHADDQHLPFRPVPHFARFAPVPGSGHALVVRPGSEPKLFRLVAEDFWVEPPADPGHPFAEVLDIVEVDSPQALVAALAGSENLAYVGNDPGFAEGLGIPRKAVEPVVLMAALDWKRAFKTPYEVACVRAAAERASKGHAVVAEGVQAGKSERELHFAYLQATGQLGHETPYPNIVAWDRTSAVLHYTTKRSSAPDPAHTFLIDAGATTHGYASDITRTYTRDGAHPVFAALLEGVKRLQRTLVDQVAPGVSYVELHETSFRGICDLLSEHRVLKVGSEEAFERGLAQPFYPHGLGHHLGLQVHDVGGRQVDPDGRIEEPPERFKWLRTTRPLAEGHVVTIEPGLYLIPMLLDPHRGGDDAAAFDWDLIDALIPCGGIRIEDDVLVTADGREDLSRPQVP